MNRRRRAGSSALELVITVAVFATVMSGLVGVLQSATSSSRQFEGEGSLEEKARQTTEAIVRELRWAQAGTLLVTQDSGSSRLDFRVPAGMAGNAVVWSSTITVKYAASNVDADHDGNADDGALVRIQDGVTRVLCNWVPAGGFAVAANGANLVLTLQLQATDAQRRVLRARATDSASARN